jgi:regulator of protease activity HflC (stomatin/prohibitin superfamily)
MFDRIIDFLISIIDKILPVVVVDHYNQGVRLRFGKYNAVLNPGLHFKIPFVDKVIEEMVKTTTVNLSEQTITTKDWRSVVVRAIIKYEVGDVKLFLLEVNDAIDALSDMSKGIIRDQIKKRDWKDCNGDDLEKEIYLKIRKEASKWGLKVLEVTLTDLGEVPSFRLFNSGFLQT